MYVIPVVSIGGFLVHKLGISKRNDNFLVVNCGFTETGLCRPLHFFGMIMITYKENITNENPYLYIYIYLACKTAICFSFFAYIIVQCCIINVFR